jgi:hypothetical protein
LKRTKTILRKVKMKCPKIFKTMVLLTLCRSDILTLTTGKTGAQTLHMLSCTSLAGNDLAEFVFCVLAAREWTITSR